MGQQRNVTAAEEANEKKAEKMSSMRNRDGRRQDFDLFVFCDTVSGETGRDNFMIEREKERERERKR